MQLELDVSRSHPLITGHQSVITDFDLPGKWIVATPPTASKLSLRQKSSLTIRHQLSKFSLLHRFRRVEDHSETIGWIPEVLLHPPTKTLRGYFQSWRYIEIAGRFGYPTRPQPRAISPNLQTWIDRATRERPISVHIRRGDYLQVPEFGVLGRSYYEMAVGVLRDLGNRGPLWVFTDSPNLAREIVDGEIINGLEKPTEELVLMSKCHAHIIANSTFSWWGAWMNIGLPSVIAPTPWFKDGPEIQDLIPPAWITIPHQ